MDTARADTHFTHPDLEAVADEIADLAAHIHAATCRMLQLLYRFDVQHGWQGWASCAQWLSWRTGISVEAAREKVRVARALRPLPRITEAFERGEISYSKVRAMTRIARPETEETLLMIAVHGTASHVEKVVRGYRRADPDREVTLANRNHQERFLSTHLDDQGNLVIRAKLPPELGARVAKALDAAADAIDGGRESNGGQRRADALVQMADSALAAKMSGRSAAETHQIVVHVDAGVLADPGADGRSGMGNGARVSAETSRRLSCDAAIVPLLEDADGNPLSVGRRRRTVPPSIRRALHSRDPGCRFPGCHHTRFLEAHHIEHWANGGETKLTNLVHLCSFHHRELHEGGFRVRGGAAGELEFVTSHGVVVEDVPQAPQASPAGLSEKLRQLDVRADRVAVWEGGAIDYGYAIEALLQEASRGAARERVSAETR